MSGILDPKNRILDTIVTLEGRRQMVGGKFKIEYVTFTDGATFYKGDVVSGSADASKRLFFECANLPQDQICFEADDAGKILPFKNTSGFTIASGKIFSGSSDGITILTGSEFASTAGSLLGSSLDNFKNLYSVGTVDSIFEDEDFEISHSSVNFKVTDANPIADMSEQVADINQLESFFQDERLSNISNFKYLPPLNRVSDSFANVNDSAIRKQYKLGEFPPLGSSEPLTFETITERVENARKKGNVVTVRFDPTNNANRLAAQFFEIQTSDLLKLDVIDFGTFRVDDQTSPTRHVLFAGKVFEDDFGSHTFVNLFTLIFR